MKEEKSIKGELVIKNKGKEKTKKIEFLEIKEEPKGDWKEIKHKKSNKWLNSAVRVCHDDLKERVNLMNTKPQTTFYFLFNLDKIKYKVEIIVFSINEVHGEHGVLIDRELETETKVFKE